MSSAGAVHTEGRTQDAVRRSALALVAAWAALTATMTAVGVVVTNVVFGGARADRDEAMSRWLAEHRTAGLNSVTEYATYLGNTEGIVLVAFAAVVVLVAVGDRAGAWWVVLALVLELSVFLASSTVIDRPRPVVVRLNSTPTTDSFPSGHSAATTALYGIIALSVLGSRVSRPTRGAVAVLAMVVVAAVSFSRAYRGMHHVTDVLAGLVLGGLAIVAAHGVVRVFVVANRSPVRPATRRFPWS